MDFEGNNHMGNSERRLITLLMVLILFLTCIPSIIMNLSSVKAWSNGGFSSDPNNPNYGTHDWIAEHALDWLPNEEKQYILNNLAAYLYGTELPDNNIAPDGIGDVPWHHVYFNQSEIMTEDWAAFRANWEYERAIYFLNLSDFANASRIAGIMSHYLADVAAFGHVMGSGTPWGAEIHHADYETYVNEKTNNYSDDFNSYLHFDGSLDFISAYNTTKNLAYDTTFDIDGNLTCVWMDQNYDWSNPVFMNRAGESLNLAVNYLADVLHTIYAKSTSGGEKITIFPAADVGLLFANATEGTTIVNKTLGPPPPTGRVVKKCYDIETTVNYSGKIVVKIIYDVDLLVAGIGRDVTPEEEQTLQLMQWNETELQWENLTAYSDVKNNLITGNASHLSMFGVTCLQASIPERTRTIYIRADGSIDPPDAPILSFDNATYTFTGNINDSIVIERDNILIDGAGYTVEGTGITYMGINLTSRSNVTIKNMTIKAFDTGIRLDSSSNNRISGSNISNNRFGISFISSSSNTIHNDTLSNNEYDGMFFSSSDNNTLYDNMLSNNEWAGICLDHSSANALYGNTLSGNYDGIIAYNNSSNNRLYGNTVLDTIYRGISLATSSGNNTVYSNIISNSERYGIMLYLSDNNSFYGNIISENKWDGILVVNSSDNMFFHNYFSNRVGGENNTMQAYVYEDGRTNTWDIGYPSGGNYWSDYDGLDSDADGIGDTEYVIDTDNIDHYPLMGMFSDFNSTSECCVQTICNSSIFDFQSNGTSISFNVTGEDSTAGFCRICIPTALMNATYRVFVNDTEVPCNLLPCSNTNHSYLYFTYSHSSEQIVIVPEFPSFMILPLFMLSTMLAVAFMQRKIPRKHKNSR